MNPGNRIIKALLLAALPATAVELWANEDTGRSVSLDTGLKLSGVAHTASWCNRDWWAQPCKLSYLVSVILWSKWSGKVREN